MAHRSPQSGLVGRIYSQQGLQVKSPHTLDLGSPADIQSQRKIKRETPVVTSCETRTLIEEDTSGYKTIQGDNHADTYNPNHPQIVRFYKKWGKRE